MNSKNWWLALGLGVAACAVAAPAPRAEQDARYPTSAEFGARLGELARQHEGAVQLVELAPGIPLLIVGRVPASRQRDEPALLVVAGLEPDDLAGPLVAAEAVESLIVSARTNDTARRCLESVTLYVVPRLAGGEFPWHVRPRAERGVSGGPPVDDDHDGLVDEDGPEDLNADGWITALRVQDPSGEFLPDPAEPRLLLRADRVRGEVGAWRLLTEGRDDDGDEAWNEDGPGGVNPNRNFAAGYRFFDVDAGAHPMSEPATRALADFVIARPHIGLVFTLGGADNLSDAPKAEGGGKRPMTLVHEADLPWVKELGAVWRRTLRLEKELPGATVPGSFPDWVYFHRGRLALSARPWFPGLTAAFPKAAGAETNRVAPSGSSSNAVASSGGNTNLVRGAGEAGKKPEPDKRNEEERAFLRWLDGQAPGSFLAWQPVEHPDFPGRRVEVGGYLPWVKSNPPEAVLAEVVRRESTFLFDLVGRLPRIGIRRAEARPQGNGVFDLRLEVENTGYLPTVLAHGETTREVAPTRVTLGVEDAAVLSGSRVTRLGPIPGSGGRAEVRWVVLVPGRTQVEVEVVSALAGRAKVNMTLTEERR